MDFSDFLPTENYSADNEEEEEPTAESNKDNEKIIGEADARPLGARTMT